MHRRYVTEVLILKSWSHVQIHSNACLALASAQGLSCQQAVQVRHGQWTVVGPDQAASCFTLHLLPLALRRSLQAGQDMQPVQIRRGGLVVPARIRQRSHHAAFINITIRLECLATGSPHLWRGARHLSKCWRCFLEYYYVSWLSALDKYSWLKRVFQCRWCLPEPTWSHRRDLDSHPREVPCQPEAHLHQRVRHWLHGPERQRSQLLAQPGEHCVSLAPSSNKSILHTVCRYIAFDFRNTGEDKAFFVLDFGCCMRMSKVTLRNSHNAFSYNR